MRAQGECRGGKWYNSVSRRAIVANCKVADNQRYVI